MEANTQTFKAIWRIASEKHDNESGDVHMTVLSGVSGRVGGAAADYLLDQGVKVCGLAGIESSAGRV